ncbi:MAG: NAD(P)/FAD-dependent oxidoreductase [Mycobacteriales bacterium]
MTVDAVVIGAGPNGLVAATLLARAGWSVELLERRAVAGGAIGSVTTGRGYVHDWGSAFFGVLHSFPVFEQLGLDRRVAWANTDIPVAAAWNPAGEAAVMRRDPEATAAGLGLDAGAWLATVAEWHRLGAPLFDALMGPIGALPPLARFAIKTTPRELVATARSLLEPVEHWVAHRYDDDAARMLFASNATHADIGIDSPGSTPAAMLLAMAAQTRGMPVPVGGAQVLAAAMVEAAQEAGVAVRTGVDVTGVVVRGGRAVGVRCSDGTGIAAGKAVVADVAPTTLARELVGEQHLPGGWLKQLQRHRYTSGYFRLDVDLAGPAPWSDERLGEATVVHITGDLDELAMSQAQVRRQLLPDLPQLIVGQQDRADPGRVPIGAAALWAECHCPARPRNAKPGWEKRFAGQMLERIEEHAPGTRDLVVETTATSPLDLEGLDPNLVGGDVGGGSASIDQMLVFRPVAGWSPYALPVGGLYMCGAASHPGGGVHGMCGRNAAATVLRDARIGLSWMRSRLAR